MTGNDHFCEVVFDEVRVPGANLVGECNGSFRQVMRQMEHERGGIDRLVSNRLLFESVRRSAWIDHRDPLVRQELARLEIGYRIGRLLVLREVLGQAPQHFSAATKVICTEYEQDVAAFCARRRGTVGDAVRRGWGSRESCRARRLLRAGVHDHGRHHADPAQHRRRTDARSAALNARRASVGRRVRRSPVRA